jgi:hypothetical protein
VSNSGPLIITPPPTSIVHTLTVQRQQQQQPVDHQDDIFIPTQSEWAQQRQINSVVTLFSRQSQVQEHLSSVDSLTHKVSRPAKQLHIAGTDNSFRALFDTGADVSCVSQRVFDRLNQEQLRKLHLPDDFRQVVSAGNNNLKITGFFEIPFVIDGHTFWHPTIIVDGLNSEVILGVDFLHRYEVSIHGNRVKMPESPASDKLSLLCKRSVVIPALSTSPLLVMAEDQWDGKDFMVSNDLGDQARVSVLRALHSWVGGEATVVVVNCTAEPVSLKRHEKIADFIFVAKQDMCKITPLVVANIQTLQNNENVRQRCPATWDQQNMISRMIIKTGNQQEKNACQNLIWKYRDSFSSDQYDVGRAKFHLHEPKMVDNTPVNVKQFPLPLAKEEAVHKWVDKLLAQAVIERSYSAYNSPLFLVKKRTETAGKPNFRVVLDYRQVNENTAPDTYSMREIRSCLDQIGRISPKTFSSLDLTNGFHQLPLAEGARDPTSFTIFGKGHYRFTSAPQGAMTSPAGFSRMMDIVCQGMKNVLAYVDDILVMSPNQSLHLQHLEQLFIRLKQNGLKLNLDKCTFASEQVSYLGFLITGEGIAPGTDKLAAIKQFPLPRTLKEVRSWVGLCNFFREHVLDFNKYSAPMTKLTKKDCSWKSGTLPPDAIAAFRALQKLLCTAPIIAYPRSELPFLVTCDAATGEVGTGDGGGYGAYLSQRDPKTGKERVIAYASRGLRKHEISYSAYTAEMSCITWAIIHWHTYLYGNTFTVFTDHQPLVPVNKMNAKTLNRLQELRTAYQFDITYKRGCTNVVADALSRAPVDSPEMENPHIKHYNMCEIVRHNYPANSDFATNNGIEQLQMAQNDDALFKDVKTVIFGHLLHPTMTKLQRRQISALAAELEIDVSTGLVVRKDTKVIFAPASIRRELLQLTHSSKMGGHMGLDKTIGRLNKNFWWPKMQSDIKKYISFCDICQKADPALHKRTLQAPMQKFSEATVPNEKLFGDLIGPLHNENGYKYCLVLQCEFTKMIEVVALKSKEASEVAAAIYKHWILRKGSFKSFGSDNGKEFVNSVMKELADRFGFKHVTTTPYHPQANPIERVNRIVISYVKKNVENTNEWPELLPALCMAYNTMDHSSTKFSPFLLFHGHSPNLPVQELAKHEPIYSTSAVAENFIRQRAMWHSAQENLKVAREKRNNYFAKNCTERKFWVGQQVLVHRPNYLDKKESKQNYKFTQHWSTSGFISRIVSPVNVEVFIDGVKGKPRTVHINQIKPLLSDTVNDIKKQKSDAAILAVEEEGAKKKGEIPPLATPLPTVAVPRHENRSAGPRTRAQTRKAALRVEAIPFVPQQEKMCCVDKREYQ